jgi:hypothetical protein
MTTAADYTMGAGDFTPAVVDDSQATFAGVMGTIAGLSGGANKVYLLSAGTETMAAAGVSNANGPVTVTVDGGGRVVELTTEIGSLITVGSNVTLVLRNITLQRGAGSNNVALVIVDNGGKLELEEGARITGNISYSNSFDTSGGGVYIASGGIFTMTGGEISGNGAYYGGGVYIATGGIFTMSGGAIAGNTAFHTTSSSFYYAYGGGVYVGPGGIFTMNGGEIADNEVGARYPYGGGVSVSGTFTMYGGKISGNMAKPLYLAQNEGNNAHGGGVSVHSSGTFTMYGGEISDNNVTGYDYVRRVEGGGVYAEGAFIMSGGKISGNTASVTSYYSYLTPVYGGGVFVTSNGTFIMSGGEISGNAVSGQEKVSSVDGGGVYTDGAFTMSGGEISGNTASYSNSSTAHTSGGGVFVNSGTFTMSGGTVSGNILSNTEGYGKEVLVAGTGTFTMSAAARPGRVFLANYDQSVTISGPLNGPVTPIDLGITGSVPLTRYLAVPILKLDSSYSGGDLTSLKTHFALGSSKMTDSPYTEEAIPGFYSINDGGLFIHLSINIKDIIYSDQWGGAWTLESDGRRRSPLIGHNGRTTMRVSFTSTVANAVIAIRLDVSSEANYDFAFITYLDRDSGSGSYDRISGGTGKVVTIPVPTAGSHFVDIVYDKDYMASAGSDCAWFRIE